MRDPKRQTMSIRDGRLLLQRLVGLRLASAEISDAMFLQVEFGMVWGGNGQASLHIESRWRASRNHGLLTGSSCNPQSAAKQLGQLLDLPIEHVDINVGVYDVTIALDGGHRITSFNDGPGQPLWGIAINDANLLRGAVDVADNSRPWIAVRGNRIEIEFTFEGDDLLVLES